MIYLIMKVDDEPQELFSYLTNMGFQATEVMRASSLIKRMLNDSTVLLSFTANMVASGLRGIFKEMVKQKMVDVIYTTAGAIEHDYIKSQMNYLLGDFKANDWELRKQGISRIGNILVPPEAYPKLEEVFNNITDGKDHVGAQELVYELGKRAGPESIFYWAQRHSTPVAVPGITDGALGFFTSFKKQYQKTFYIDVTDYMEEVKHIVLGADKLGGIVLGGGISKHHLIGSAIPKGGLDYAVYFTTASEWDGSLSGAPPREAVSWNKIKGSAIKVFGDVTINFTLAMWPILHPSNPKHM